MPVCAACTFADTPDGDAFCLICDTPFESPPRKKVKTTSVTSEKVIDLTTMNSDEGSQMWDFDDAFVPNGEICETLDCGKKACALWRCAEPARTWLTCEECQFKDFGGWPLIPHPKGVSASPTESDSVSDSKPKSKSKSIVILIGIPGSGKSTFASSLPPSAFVTVNQDVLKTRLKCEKLCRSTLLSTSKIPVIDRTNITFDQRNHWYKIAHEFSAHCFLINFEVDVQTCRERCYARKDHPTLNTASAINTVTGIMNGQKKKNMLMDSEFEGIKEILLVRNEKSFEGAVRRIENLF
ncbi:hypothetical protein TrST_g5962 [Triparma strigata]|uniref:Uncharacterized protein n=1 Tax=Triparma strigata TaxID=1606541 RepID=A0A9W7BZ12_9STRA|nr:hypothetical protein TrST_g5962 [Triparma strigata]